MMGLGFWDRISYSQYTLKKQQKIPYSPLLVEEEEEDARRVRRRGRR
jgi:hypothetical protein